MFLRYCWRIRIRVFFAHQEREDQWMRWNYELSTTPYGGNCAGENVRVFQIEPICTAAKDRVMGWFCFDVARRWLWIIYNSDEQSFVMNLARGPRSWVKSKCPTLVVGKFVISVEACFKYENSFFVDFLN